MNTDSYRTRFLQRGGTAFGLTLAILSTVGPGLAMGQDAPPATIGPSPPAGPQLSIAIDNGGTSTESGATLTYTITVRNLGSADVSGLEVTQSVPAGLTIKSVDSAGAAEGGDVTWGVDLKATAEATFHSTMTVVDTPSELLRLATVACAGTAGTEPPIVCATHSDQLPAGAAAEARRAAPAPNTSSSGHRWWWYVAGGAGLLIVALVAFLIRRRHHHPSPTRPVGDPTRSR